MIDLACWNLTIPAGAAVIPTKKLLAGYQDPFYHKRPDGAQVMIAPSSGQNIKATKNSTYPRCEYRETMADGTLVWWKPWERTHTLWADLQIDTLGESEKGIFGQYHGKGTNVPVKLNLTGTTLYMHLRRKFTPDDIEDGDPDYPEDKIVILKNYKLGTRFTYKIELNEKMQLNVWINGALVLKDYQFDVDSYRNAYKGEGDRWYAKAGVYSQTKVGKKGQGQATFYALSITHTDAPEDQPEAPAAPETPTATPATPATPAQSSLAEQITATYESWKAGKTATRDALVAMNAFSKQVASIPTSQERAPYYAQINDLKDRVSGAKK